MNIVYIYIYDCILIKETYFKHDPNPQKTIRKPTDNCQQNKTSASEFCCSTTRETAISAPHKTPRTTEGNHHKTAKKHWLVSILYQFISYMPLPWPWRRHPSAAGLCWRSRASGLEGRLGVGESGGVAGAGAGTPRGTGPRGEENHGKNEVKHGWKWMEPEFKVLKKTSHKGKIYGKWRWNIRE